MKTTFQEWFDNYIIESEPPNEIEALYDCRAAWRASRTSTLAETKESVVEAVDKAHRQATEEALNACISYVKNGTGDFTEMPHGLVTYFKQQVDNKRKS